jgi:hypothetical protein
VKSEVRAEGRTLRSSRFEEWMESEKANRMKGKDMEQSCSQEYVVTREARAERLKD